MKNKNQDLLKYLGVGLIGMILFSKLGKASPENNLDTTIDNPGGAPSGSPISTQNLDVSNIQVLPDKKTDKGAKFNLYFTINNPFPNEIQIESIEGILYWGPIKIIPLNFGKSKVPSSGAVIPASLIITYSSLTPVAAAKVKSNTWISGAYIKGTVKANGITTAFNRPLTPLDPNKISGVNQNAGLAGITSILAIGANVGSCCSSKIAAISLPKIQSI